MADIALQYLRSLNRSEISALLDEVLDDLGEPDPRMLASNIWVMDGVLDDPTCLGFIGQPLAARLQPSSGWIGAESYLSAPSAFAIGRHTSSTILSTDEVIPARMAAGKPTPPSSASLGTLSVSSGLRLQAAHASYDYIPELDHATEAA